MSATLITNICPACGSNHARLDIRESVVTVSDDHRHDLQTRLLAEILLFMIGIHHELRKLTKDVTA
jgi:hypothetical protein